MVRRLISFILTIFLMGYISNVFASGNYIYKISKGDKFVLKQDIAIAARDAHVLLQDGKVKRLSSIDKYAPFCRFEVNTKGEQTIKPDSLTVTKVSQNEPEVLPYIYNYYVKFDLSSAKDPNIRSLACGAWGSSTDTYITIPQMQQALGNYFETPVLK